MSELLQVFEKNRFITEMNSEFDSVILRYFPLIKTRRFTNTITAMYQIQNGPITQGIYYQTVPLPNYACFGKYESSIVVFPQFQNQGIGKNILGKIRNIQTSTYFMVRSDNQNAIQFFGKRTELNMVKKSGNFFIYIFRIT